MPQPSRPPHPHHHPHAEHQTRPAHGRGQSAAAVSRHLHRPPRADYTLAHGGRQVRIGPIAFWIVVGTLVIMGVWSILTGTYFAFREDVLTGLISRQANMQFAYEDRIAELRAQVDRVTSRQLLDQEQFEQKLNALLKRQSVLEQRTNALNGDGITTGSIKPSRSTPSEETLKPSPINDTVIFVAPPDREARLESRELPIKSAGLAARATAGGLDGILTRVSLSLDKIEQKQTAMLGGMEEKADNKLSRMRNVLSDLGVSVKKAAAAAHVGLGGPFVPLRAPPANASNFDRQLYRINVTRAEISQFTHALVTVPVRKPVPGEVELNSPFGMRMDPFLGRPAIHTGIDLHGETGEPARATASGRVTIAGRDGGYGNLVEINHGNGLSTRYGHLSEIDVKVGQQVTVGQTIGKIGSTGRSTGPHLHYETRINGEPVDPQKFLRAGLRLGNV